MTHFDVISCDKESQTELNLHEIKVRLSDLRRRRRRVPNDLKQQILSLSDGLLSDKEILKEFKITRKVLIKWESDLVVCSGTDKTDSIEFCGADSSANVEDLRPSVNNGASDNILLFPEIIDSVKNDDKVSGTDEISEIESSAPTNLVPPKNENAGISFKIVVSTILLFSLLILLEYYLIGEAIDFYLNDKLDHTKALLRAILGELIPIFLSCIIALKVLKKWANYAAEFFLIGFFLYSAYVVAGVKILDYQNQSEGQQVTVSKSERRNDRIKYLQDQIKKYEEKDSKKWKWTIYKYEKKLEKLQDEQMLLDDTAEDQKQGLNLFKIVADSFFKLMLQVASVLCASLIITNLQSNSAKTETE